MQKAAGLDSAAAFTLFIREPFRGATPGAGGRPRSPGAHRLRPPTETFSRAHLDAALAGLRTELTAEHASALTALRAEHDTAMAAQRRDLTASTGTAASPARAEIVAAERTRIAGILGHDEAKARQGLAHHLALKSDMSAEDAIAMLAASAKEAGATAKTHRLDAIVPRPTVSADVGEVDESGMSEQQRGAAAFAAARGVRSPAR